MKQILYGLITAAVLYSLAGTTSFVSAQSPEQPATEKLPETPAGQAIPSIPTAIIPTWSLFGVDPDMAKKLTPELTKARLELIKKWATPQGETPGSLTGGPTNGSLMTGSLADFAAANRRKIRPLLEPFAKTVAASKTGTPAAIDTSFVYEPVLCKIADRYILHLGAADTILGTLVDAANISIDARQLERSLNSGLTGRPNGSPADKIDLTALTRGLATRLDPLAALNSARQKVPSALHVGMTLAREQTRRDEGSAFCAQALLAEKLVRQGFTVVRPWGNETLGKMRNTLGLPPALRRPTRTLVMLWDLPRSDQKKAQQPQALTLKASIQIAESVTGQPLPKISEIAWQGNIGSNGEIALESKNRELDLFLDQERNALSLKEAPQVARINRAWVYLDKGRAYGLRMNDRLVVEGGPRDYGAAIKGHVVGFYGPEKKIQSPRGFPVHEGAILFIRKGQGQAKLGQTFVYDETTFPTQFPAGGR